MLRKRLWVHLDKFRYIFSSKKSHKYLNTLDARLLTLGLVTELLPDDLGPVLVQFRDNQGTLLPDEEERDRHRHVRVRASCVGRRGDLGRGLSLFAVQSQVEIGCAGGKEEKKIW